MTKPLDLLPRSYSLPVSPSPVPPVFPFRRLFYLNALFDLELGGHPLDRVRAVALEMGALFSFCGTTTDRILIDVRVPDDYWNYLESLSIPNALPLGNKDNPADYAGVAWGWNEKSAARLKSVGCSVSHPDLSIIKKINGRAFCAEFNAASGTGVPGSRFCATPDDFKRAARELCDQFPLVAKPAFGGSGMGFVVINNPGDVESALRDRIDPLLQGNGCTIEPWCERVHDVSSSCVINDDGTIRDLRHYRCFTNRRGMFYGVPLGSPQDAVVEEYRDDLETAVISACKSLAQEGYSGPVSFDSFVYRDKSDGSEKLAPVIEINGRYIMSTIAHALYSSIGNDRSCYFRFLSRKTCIMPAAYDECGKNIGDDWYDPQKRQGVIFLTPLRVSHGSQWVQPVRSAFFMVGSGSEEIAAMDERLRNFFTP